MSDTQRFIDETVDWLNRRVVPDGLTIDADTRLFETGIIDSLAMLRLVAWTERALGRRIENREMRMDRFASVRHIASAFPMAAPYPAATATAPEVERC